MNRIIIASVITLALSGCETIDPNRTYISPDECMISVEWPDELGLIQCYDPPAIVYDVPDQPVVPTTAPERPGPSVADWLFDQHEAAQ